MKTLATLPAGPWHYNGGAVYDADGRCVAMRVSSHSIPGCLSPCEKDLALATIAKLPELIAALRKVDPGAAVLAEVDTIAAGYVCADNWDKASPADALAFLAEQRGEG